MILTCKWKLFQDRHYRNFRKESIIEFAYILANKLIDQAKAQQASPENTEIESQVSQLSTTAQSKINYNIFGVATLIWWRE